MTRICHHLPQEPLNELPKGRTVALERRPIATCRQAAVAVSPLVFFLLENLKILASTHRKGELSLFVADERSRPAEAP